VGFDVRRKWLQIGLNAGSREPFAFGGKMGNREQKSSRSPEQTRVQGFCGMLPRPAYH